jgi:hypothetical protein
MREMAEDVREIRADRVCAYEAAVLEAWRENRTALN